mgnify:CR=1 FL=1
MNRSCIRFVDFEGSEFIIIFLFEIDVVFDEIDGDICEIVDVEDHVKLLNIIVILYNNK